MSPNMRKIFFVGVTLLPLLLAACGGGESGSTSTSDTLPPTVSTTEPPDNAVGVPIDQPIVATFSESINVGTVDSASFFIKDDGGTTVMSVAPTANGRKATFTPTAGALQTGTLYHATLTTAITDVAGNALASAFTWSFRTLVDEWVATATGSAPLARADHTAVWTGDKMIIWGGVTTGSTPTNTGATYDPVTDTWTALPTTLSGGGALTARTDHTAVWTGSKMIVWGGTITGGAPTNTGAIYDPVANTWTALPTTLSAGGALTPLVGHTAVWTGSKMIVWGGLTTGNAPTNAGAIYDPVANTWTALPTTLFGGGTLAARVGHTAIWTGADMIVWGGSIISTPVSTGARYNLATDRWTLIPNAPFANSGHTAVWTGNEMIVWGGSASSNRGARFNPSTSAWTEITTTGAPSARVDHSAIWTGTEMIVWGGNVASNQGAAYRLSTDTWRTISVTSDTPTARTDHTAIWTGDGTTTDGEMIVWGGQSSGGFENTGGRYTP